MNNKPRLFLVAPQGLTPASILSCVKAAKESGDPASILLPTSALSLTPELQSLDLAVLCDGDEASLKRYGCDGLEVSGTGHITQLRRDLPQAIIGVNCGTSRHAAMQAGEAGADYIGLSQTGKAAGGEPIIGWWSDLFEIPCVARDPVNLADLDILLPQKPDFIRPADVMWDGPDQAKAFITGLMKAL